MKRAFVIAAVIELGFVVVLLHSTIKDFLWTHPWWHSFLVAIPTIALPILACLDLLHSGEANALRAKASELQAALDAERNKQLGEIAKNTARPVTPAERNAAILRKYLRARVIVTEDHGSWGGTPEIVEVNDDCIVTLFTPRGPYTSNATAIQAHCSDLEITEIPQGACPVRLKILKRYGEPIHLGEITQWEDRFQPAANPKFAKGEMAYSSDYEKPGSSEIRKLFIYASRDSAGSFRLEASTGETHTGDNVTISKRFMELQIEYEAAGFRRMHSGPSAGAGGQHKLFIH